MGMEKVKLDKDLLDRVKKFSELAGYSSVEEFITHCLEKEISKLEESSSEEEIKKKLKGLGYIG
jgi:metal-responsive CopG/Arc/MetJ family transcriptional regulator